MKTLKSRAIIAIFAAVILALSLAAALRTDGVSFAATTYTDNEQSNGLVVGTSEGETDNASGKLWVVEDTTDDKQKKYVAQKNSKTTPSLKFTIEGEKYFSFEYLITYTRDTYAYFTVDIDNVQCCKVNYKGADTTPQEYIMKTHGDGQHTIVVWANGAKNETDRYLCDIYFQNFRLREDNDFTKHNLKMDYNDKVLATYVVEGGNGGWNGDKDTEEQIKAAATYLTPNQEYPLPEGISFCFISFPKAYVSSISGEEVKSPILSKHIQSADGKKQLSSYGGAAEVYVTGCKITNTGIRQAQNDHANTGSIFWQCAGYDLKDITCEYAPTPKVFYVENGNEDDQHLLEYNQTVALPYGKFSLPIRIKTVLEDYQNYYQVKVDGVAADVTWKKMGDTIGTSVEVKQSCTVTVSGWFGAEYSYTKSNSSSNELGTAYLLSNGEPNESTIEKELSFSFNIDLETEHGLRDVLASADADIEVIQDATYAWYHDQDRSGEGGMAFTSGISGARAVKQKISQLGFTVKGNGVLIFDFQIDGVGTSTGTKNSWAAYNVGTQVAASSWASSTLSSGQKKDFHAYYGFNKAKATNIAFGLSANNQHNHAGEVNKEWIDAAYAAQNAKYKMPEYFSVPEEYFSATTTVTPSLNYTIQETTDSEWYRCSITFNDKEDAEETTIYIAHAVYAVSTGYTPANGFGGERMTIRNVGYYPSETNVKFSMTDQEGTDTSAGGSVSVTADGKEISLQEDGTPKLDTPIARGARVTLKANLSSDYFCYGWQEIIDGKKRIFAYGDTATYSVQSKEVQIVAIVAKQGTYAVRHNDVFYKTADIQQALDAAEIGEDKNVIAVDNVTVKTALKVPKGVNFVIPYNLKGGWTEEGTNKTAGSRVSWASGSYKQPVYKFGIEGVSVTVEGNFYVGGVIHYPDQSAQGHTSGAYSEFVNDGTVTVAKGGLMDVYGRVTGTGSIDVKSGGKLTQPFLICDYAGGNNTQDLFNLTPSQTPFRRYAMVNIQCAGGYTIEYGGELFGHASLYFWSSIHTLDQPFISYVGSVDGKSGTTTLINLKSGANAHVVYDDKHLRPAGGSNTEDVGKTTVTVTGGATAGYMNFDLGINTSKVAFSIPYNYELVLAGNKAQYEMNYAYKLMPGATFKVAEGATLTLNADFYVYDGLVQSAMSGKSYPTADQLHDAKYPTNANFIVDGTLKITNHKFLGAIQTSGASGRIEVASGATLSGDIVDGGLTGYDCNYATFSTSARVYGDGKIVAIQAGKNYVAKGGAAWTLPSVEVSYEQTNGASHKGKGHNLATANTLEADVVGQWMLEHASHSYVWTLTDGQKPSKDHPVASATLECTVFGCDHSQEFKVLFVTDVLGKLQFEGKAFDPSRLVGEGSLAYAMFAGVELSAEFVQANGDAFVGEVKDIADYFVKLSGENVLFYASGDAPVMEGDQPANSHIFGFSVSKREVKVRLLPQSQVYSGAEAVVSSAQGTGFEITDGSFADGFDPGINVSFAEGGDHINHKAYGLTADWSDKDHYDIQIDQNGATLSVTQRRITVKILNKSKEYDGTTVVTGSAKDVDFSVIGELCAVDPAIRLSVEAADKNAKTYHIVGDWDNKNYGVSFQGESGEDTFGLYEVSPAKLTVTFKKSALSRVYDGAVVTSLTFKPQQDYTLSRALFDQDALTVSATVQNAKNVGDYVLTASGDNANYELAFEVEEEGELQLSISRRPITVTAEDKNSAYGEDLQPLTLKIDGAVASELEQLKAQFELSTDAASDKEPSKYTIYVKTKQDADMALLGNYQVTPVNGEYTLNYAEFAGIKFDSDEVTYDAQQHSVAVSGQPEDSKVTYSYDGQQQGTPFLFTQKGLYRISVTVTHEGFEHPFTAEATLEIKAAKLTLTIKNTGKIYDGAAPSVLAKKDESWSVKQGTLYPNDDLGVTLTVDGAASAGTYQITGSWDNQNYDVTFQSEDGEKVYGEYTISPRPLKITVKNQSKVYDGDAPVPSNASWEVKDGQIADADKQSFSLTIRLLQASAEANDYNMIAQATELENRNYAITFVNEKGETMDENGAYAVFSVQKRAITVTIKNKSRVYNGNVASVDSVKDADYVVVGDLCKVAPDIRLSVEAADKNVNTYHITGDWDNKNYDVTFQSEDGEKTYGEFEITAVNVVVQILNKQKLYDGDPVSVTSLENSDWRRASGDLVGQDTLGVILSVAAESNVGEYRITGDWTNKNYAVTFKGEDSDNNYAIFKVSVRDISDELALSVGGATEQDGRIEAVLSGAELALAATSGDWLAELSVTVDGVETAALDKLGAYVVTVSVKANDNLTGQKTFAVTVRDQNGYTSQRLVDALEALRLIDISEVDVSNFKAEDFEILQAIADATAELTQEDLAQLDGEGHEDDKKLYQNMMALVESYNAILSGADGVIEVAKEIANAPIKALFELLAAAASLIALAFVGGKRI